jgi:hypothetical protein
MTTLESAIPHFLKQCAIVMTGLQRRSSRSVKCSSCSLSFEKPQAYSVSHSFRNQRIPSYAFLHSHCPNHNSPVPFSSSSSPSSSLAYGLSSDTYITMGGSWQPFKMTYDDDALDIDYESVYYTFNSWVNPQIESLRRDKGRGVVPPYCATAPALFPRNAHPDDIKLGQKLRFHKPSPLRNIALSNVPKQPLTEALEYSLVFWVLHLTRLGALYIVDGLRRAWTELPFRSGYPVWHITIGLTSNKKFAMNSAESTRRHWAKMSKGNGPIQGL